MREVQALIDERNTELARLTAELEALARVELEQVTELACEQGGGCWGYLVETCLG